MVEQFSDRAQKVMSYAHVEAHRLGNEQLGTEHLLLGLLREGKGTAATILQSLNVDLPALAAEIERVTPRGTPTQTSKRPPAAETKAVLDAATQESQRAGDATIGTEHLLFGLMSVSDCPACVKLRAAGVTPEAVQKAIGEHRQRHGSGGRD